ncbi:MAG TPA: SprT family zinc-dependent metalloprotease [Caulobacteraceae bacterium]|jgi:predicted metal-dependent hydrolase|nr:SprT family zinc-dependent metalloprotease [Caulobacteraceae bacterium]
MFQRASRHADGEVIEIGAARVRLTVSARARRVSLRVDRAKGEVLAIAPSLRRLGEAAAFAHERRSWIAERALELKPPTRLAPGLQLTVFGEACRLGRSPGRASLEATTWERGLRLARGADDEAYAKAVAQLLKRQAKSWFALRLALHCRALSQPVPKVSIVDARTRWGSCTPAGPGQTASIRLSWRLALAPPVVADYVAAHECAHLLHPHHGPAFWAETRRLIGDERPHRAWLKAHGGELHGFA